MDLVREGRGSRAAVRAYASQVHPVFMLPAVAASLAGGTLVAADGEGVAISLDIAAVHALAICFAVYTAHVTDGYVDFHVRGEDDDHPLTVAGCRLGRAVASVGFAACLLFAWMRSGWVAGVLTLPTWVIAVLHAPQLDVTPAGATLGYPVGVALALLGGYAVQTGGVGPLALALAGVLLVVLAGVKVVDDAQDTAYDRSIGKRTVSVVVGPDRARRWANWTLFTGGVLVLPLTIAGPFPASAPAAPLVFGAVALAAARAPPERATMLLVRGAYLLLAILLVSVHFHPLAGSAAALDITVLRNYTYLATLVAFGSLAGMLCWRAGAVHAAARTIAVLYPVAYVWDWYTLSVGVFTIPLRTGVEFAGIPLEEHLFMVVVPALVIGVHETLRPVDDQ
jgi:lycopene cyclase domain-containing protein